MLAIRLLVGGTALLLICSLVAAKAQPPMLSPEHVLQIQAAKIKPTAAQMRWQQIPWELDLHDALREAKKEQRPIFFWAAGGRDRDGVPLERC